ncbi:MAG: DUF2894 domain-containing protein [Pseudomonadales bacterium]|nr:DUF2894 domain-containing protein [Pseudomonadales bacterium]
MTDQDDTLQSKIDLLTQAGADRHDPIRFRYLESLVQRAIGQRKSIKLILENKAEKVLADYTAKYLQAKEAAKAILIEVSKSYPHSKEAILLQYRHCDFKKVEQIQTHLQRHQYQGDLAKLTDQILQENPAFQNHSKTLSFDDLLKQQEQEVAQSFEKNGNIANISNDDIKSLPPLQEKLQDLKSAHVYKQALSKLKSEELIRHLLTDGPENPGPINSHGLASRSLTLMGELSPKYLNRYISYLDSLLWLEAASESKGSKKKKARAKT